MEKYRKCHRPSSAFEGEGQTTCVQLHKRRDPAVASALRSGHAVPS